MDGGVLFQGCCLEVGGLLGGSLFHRFPGFPFHECLTLV